MPFSSGNLSTFICLFYLCSCWYVRASWISFIGSTNWWICSGGPSAASRFDWLIGKLLFRIFLWSGLLPSFSEPTFSSSGGLVHQSVLFSLLRYPMCWLDFSCTIVSDCRPIAWYIRWVSGCLFQVLHRCTSTYFFPFLPFISLFIIVSLCFSNPFLLFWNLIQLLIFCSFPFLFLPLYLFVTVSI